MGAFQKTPELYVYIYHPVPAVDMDSTRSIFLGGWGQLLGTSSSFQIIRMFQLIKSKFPKIKNIFDFQTPKISLIKIKFGNIKIKGCISQDY